MIFHQSFNSFENYNYNAFVYNNILLPAHFHGNYELIYTIDGTTELWLNDVPEILNKGELLLLSPYAIHSLRIQNAKTWIGVFSKDFIPAFSDSNQCVRYSKFQCNDEIDVFLRKNLFFEGQPDRFLLIACLYLVCSECIKNGMQLSTTQDQRFIYKVTQYISENLNQALDMQTIADTLNYEYHYFSTLFHRCFSMNFKKFVNMFRFNKACRLLADRTIGMNDICDQCGFGSIRNFNRVFKKLSGITPSAYRKLKTEYLKA